MYTERNTTIIIHDIWSNTERIGKHQKEKKNEEENIACYITREIFVKEKFFSSKQGPTFWQKDNKLFRMGFLKLHYLTYFRPTLESISEYICFSVIRISLKGALDYIIKSKPDESEVGLRTWSTCFMKLLYLWIHLLGILSPWSNGWHIDLCNYLPFKSTGSGNIQHLLVVCMIKSDWLIASDFFTCENTIDLLRQFQLIEIYFVSK